MTSQRGCLKACGALYASDSSERSSSGAQTSPGGKLEQSLGESFTWRNATFQPRRKPFSREKAVPIISSRMCAECPPGCHDKAQSRGVFLRSMDSSSSAKCKQNACSACRLCYISTFRKCILSFYPCPYVPATFISNVGTLLRGRTQNKLTWTWPLEVSKGRPFSIQRVLPTHWSDQPFRPLPTNVGTITSDSDQSYIEMGSPSVWLLNLLI